VIRSFTHQKMCPVGPLLLVACLILLIAGAAWAQTPAEEPDVMTPDEIMASSMSVNEKITEINHLLALNSRNSDLYNNLGVLYAGIEDWPHARDAFLTAVQLDPRKPDNHKNLGLVLSSLGEVNMAVLEFKAYQNLSKDGAPDAGLLIGDAWRKSGDSNQALAAYQTTLNARGGAYDEVTALTVARVARILDDLGDESALEGHLSTYADAAGVNLTNVGGQGIDAMSNASAFVVDRLLSLWTGNAQLLSESGQHAMAAQLYERALEVAPHRGDLLPLLATSWLEAGESMKAKVIAQRAVMDAPDSPAGWRAKGRIAEYEKQTRDALAAYEKAFELDPTQTDLAGRIGQIYLVLGDSRSARKFMGAVASDPNTPTELLYNYALSLQREDEFTMSLAPLRKVLDREPEMSQAWRALGMALRKSGQFAEAARAFQRAQKIQPDARVAFQAGFCHAKAGQVEQAVAAYQQTVELDPTHEKAWYNLILALMKLGDHETALVDLEILQAMEGDTYRILFNRGICCGSLGKNEEAVTAYDSALEIKETSAAWNNMGLALDRMGDKREAAECFKISKELAAEGK
jgi:tetratricopeptide (TPR) repeat protein